MRGTRKFSLPTRYRGGDSPPDVPADLPIAPDLDFTWHEHAECAWDDEAEEAIAQIQKVGKRPWARWCGSCPVKAHCLEQGFAEDQAFPSRSIGRQRMTVKAAPFVYGGLTPAERRGMSLADKKRHAARLRYEKGWLARLRKRAS